MLTQLSEAALDALLDEACPSRPAWRRSARGNLTRNYAGFTLTVFHRWGSWRWSIAGTDGVTYSPGSHDTEEAAAVAVLEAVAGVLDNQELGGR